MSKLFGVDIAGILKSAMASGLLPVKLTRLQNGARTAGDLTAGPAVSRKTYNCRGVATEYALSQFDGDLVQKGDRKVLILGATLPANVVPQTGDLVAIEGVESQVVDVRRDPATATYECQVRGA